ncbi:hypothetical protein NP233_g9273 [Leucocoprinus birnbaumii]|uniref:BTB domain-containing protein n=1 Tax=Leucocoprinus birnbaumii TaxID=56174 RepID=A0AAD5VKR5_9AGAR|nr:hypothetical protein NP233_g9273 [Leucocoprinus birnbaumii]
MDASAPASLTKAEPMSPPPPAAKYARDTDYYYHDGSCVFLVGGRLFKIHRSQLERHSNVFKTILATPAEDMKPTSGLEGFSDEHPIVREDSVAEFRALCWVIYATPAEIVDQFTSTKADVPRMISLISVTHKYDMPGYRDWAFSAINKIAQAGQIQPSCKSWENLQQLLDLSHKSKQFELASRIQFSWIKSIEKSPKALRPFTSALRAAENSKLRGFHAQIYYTYLRANGALSARALYDPASSSIDKIVSHVTEHPSVDIGDTHRLRLYQGFWSLTQLRHRLDTPPSLNGNAQCAVHATACQPSWEAWWKDFLAEAQQGGKQRIGDPGELLLKLQQIAMKKPIANITATSFGTLPPVPCQAQIQTQVCAMKKTFDENLAERFMIPV